MEDGELNQTVLELTQELNASHIQSETTLTHTKRPSDVSTYELELNQQFEALSDRRFKIGRKNANHHRHADVHQ